METEVERLAQRDAASGLRSRHVSWGPSAPGDAEGRATILNRVLAQCDAEMADTVPVPRVQLEAIHTALRKLSQMGRASIQEWDAMSEAEAELRREVGRLAEFPSIFAGQWLRRSAVTSTS